MAPMSKQNPLPFPGEQPEQTPADTAQVSPMTIDGPVPAHVAARAAAGQHQADFRTWRFNGVG